MKKLVSLFVFILGFLMLTSGVSAAEYHEIINKHHVQIEVKEDGQYRFKHAIDVTFYTPAYGIFVNIPTAYQMNWQLEDGSQVQRKYTFPLSDFDIVGPHQIEKQSEGVQLRLGQAGVYVSDLQHYQYAYTMKTRDLRIGGRQRFYINLLGQDWVSPTEKFVFEIHFPKPVDADKISFYSGAYGAQITNQISYSLSHDGLILSGYTLEPLEPYQALTVDIALDNNYFTFPKGLNAFALGGVYGIALFALFMNAFFKHGKDDPVVPTVQFEAPEGLSSAQVGYIFDGYTDPKDIVSLIIYWAAHGFLFIEELDKRNIQLTKIKELPQTTILAERQIFNRLFLSDDIVTTKELKYKFYNTMVEGQQNINAYFSGAEEHHIFSRKADNLQILFAFLLPSIFAIYLGLSHYKIGYNYKASLVFMGMIWSFGIGIPILIAFFFKKWPSLKKFARFLFILGIAFGIFIYTVVVANLAMDVEASFGLFMILYGIYLIAIFINGNMHKRTALGLSYYNDILGLKNFIQMAEKGRLETLVEEDPEYFYHILPFAYVLNVSDVWSKKFESITMAPPSWYASATPMDSVYFMSHFNRNLNRSINSLYSSMSSPPPSKGGSGGGSFGGGGGFSGGGFGGGGGGGWR